jgi:hypothetical protein
VSFICVATNLNQLRILATGQGTLTPNYSNAVLEIGRSYTNTAAGVNGHVFTNWVISTNWAGGVPDTNAVLRFVMQSNLTLQVNFADVTKPTNTIAAPTDGQQVGSVVFTVEGAAKDNVAVAAVFYQLNANPWVAALSINGWTNWTAEVTLMPGTNAVKAYAVDASGNKSLTNSVSFSTTNVFNLRLSIGAGQPLTGNGFELRVDASPGLPGQIEFSTNFVNWTKLTNFVGTNAPMNFRDSAATNSNQRFYRAVAP